MMFLCEIEESNIDDSIEVVVDETVTNTTSDEITESYSELQESVETTVTSSISNTVTSTGLVVPNHTELQNPEDQSTSNRCSNKNAATMTSSDAEVRNQSNQYPEKVDAATMTPTFPAYRTRTTPFDNSLADNPSYDVVQKHFYLVEKINEHRLTCSICNDTSLPDNARMTSAFTSLRNRTNRYNARGNTDNLPDNVRMSYIFSGNRNVLSRYDNQLNQIRRTNRHCDSCIQFNENTSLRDNEYDAHLHYLRTTNRHCHSSVLRDGNTSFPFNVMDDHLNFLRRLNRHCHSCLQSNENTSSSENTHDGYLNRLRRANIHCHSCMPCNEHTSVSDNVNDEHSNFLRSRHCFSCVPCNDNTSLPDNIYNDHFNLLRRTNSHCHSCMSCEDDRKLSNDVRMKTTISGVRHVSNRYEYHLNQIRRTNRHCHPCIPCNEYDFIHDFDQEDRLNFLRRNNRHYRSHISSNNDTYMSDDTGMSSSYLRLRDIVTRHNDDLMRGINDNIFSSDDVGMRSTYSGVSYISNRFNNDLNPLERPPLNRHRHSAIPVSLNSGHSTIHTFVSSKQRKITFRTFTSAPNQQFVKFLSSSNKDSGSSRELNIYNFVSPLLTHEPSASNAPNVTSQFDQLNSSSTNRDSGSSSESNELSSSRESNVHTIDSSLLCSETITSNVSKPTSAIDQLNSSSINRDSGSSSEPKELSCSTNGVLDQLSLNRRSSREYNVHTFVSALINSETFISRPRGSVKLKILTNTSRLNKNVNSVSCVTSNNTSTSTVQSLDTVIHVSSLSPSLQIPRYSIATLSSNIMTSTSSRDSCIPNPSSGNYVNTPPTPRNDQISNSISSTSFNTSVSSSQTLKPITSTNVPPTTLNLRYYQIKSSAKRRLITCISAVLAPFHVFFIFIYFIFIYFYFSESHS